MMCIIKSISPELLTIVKNNRLQHDLLFSLWDSPKTQVRVNRSSHWIRSLLIIFMKTMFSMKAFLAGENLVKRFRQNSVWNTLNFRLIKQFYKASSQKTLYHFSAIITRKHFIINSP
jgi:hypothetical protein